MPLWHRKIQLSTDNKAPVDVGEGPSSSPSSTRAPMRTLSSLFRSSDGRKEDGDDDAKEVNGSMPLAMNDHPPSYASASAGGPVVKYSFSDAEYGAMTLALHNPAEKDVRPVYHITSRPNCFMPLSFRTYVRREAADGELVGFFEFGVSSEPARIIFMGRESPLREMLYRIDKPKSKALKVKGKWCWVNDRPEREIVWDYSTHPIYTCNNKQNPTVKLAKFFPETIISGRPVPAEVEVTPAGQEYFDELLVALLILERKRLQPVMYDGDEITKLFNF